MKLIEHARNLELLLRRVCDTRSLLPVPKRFLPDLDAFRDPSSQARLDEVVVNQDFFRDSVSPASWPA